jgi:hypothetical protein
MKQAATEQRFELAGQLKHQLAFAWKWHDHLLPLLHAEEDLHFLLVIPVTRRRACKPFLFRTGHLAEGPVLADRKLPAAAAAWVAGQMARPAEPLDPTIRMEQTWLVAHFRHSREGDASLIRPLRAGQPWTEGVKAQPLTHGGKGQPAAALEDELQQWVRQRRPLRPAAAPAADATPDLAAEAPGPPEAHRQ